MPIEMLQLVLARRVSAASASSKDRDDGGWGDEDPSHPWGAVQYPARHDWRYAYINGLPPYDRWKER